MKLKDNIRVLLREHYGEFQTHLEHKYETKLTENLILGDLESKKAWLTYNQVILELKHSLKNMLLVKELQYRLTEDTNPNEVCIDVIKEVKNGNPELDRLYHKIRSF